jgi:hypothetical protein
MDTCRQPTAYHEQNKQENPTGWVRRNLGAIGGQVQLEPTKLCDIIRARLTSATLCVQ